MPVMGLREYARHRGCALSAVQRAIDSKRITRLPDGKIDSEQADRDWTANTNVAKRHVETQPAAPLLTGDLISAPLPAVPDELKSLPFGELPPKTITIIEAAPPAPVPLDSFMAAKTRIAQAEAAMAEYKLDVARGLTLPTERVRRIFYELGEVINDALQQIAPKLAVQLMGKTDLREIEETARAFVDEARKRLAVYCDDRIVPVLGADESESRSAVA